MSIQKTQDNFKFALITPSYAPDFERCRLLVESVERCLIDNTKHYIIVDQRDVDLFKPLTSSKVNLLVVEELLPFDFFRVPGLRKWWISLRTFPIRNWILQQLVKMSVCDAIDENILVFCDSDNTFIREFDMKSCFVQDERLALLKVNFKDKNIDEWIEVSKKVFGLEDKAIQAATYVSNMITWYKPNILKMRSHIEEVNGANWVEVLCRFKNFSEYMLYGIFVEYIQGIDNANHFYFDTELIKPSWSIPLKTKAQIEDFFDQSKLKSSHIGVMLHSKDDIPIDLYADIITRSWS